MVQVIRKRKLVFLFLISVYWTHTNLNTCSCLTHPSNIITNRSSSSVYARIISPLASTSSSSSSESSCTTSLEDVMSVITPIQTLWFQHHISLTAPKRGCHLITGDILRAAGNDLKKIHVGMANVFVQHTSASLTINENADSDVRTDMETALNRIVPAAWNRDGTFRHTLEGDDDMPGHVKSSLMGVSLSIPIANGKLALGTWQGIYLNEHRDQGGWGGGHTRNIVITLHGQAK